MPTYEPTLFVEPLGYQPVEFLDIPQMSETLGTSPVVAERGEKGDVDGNRMGPAVGAGRRVGR